MVYSLRAHIVLVTKYRRGAITDRVRKHLIGTASEVCVRFETVLLEADGEDDHLHLLVDYPPKVSLSKLVGAIKTNTSLRVRKERFPEVTAALWGGPLLVSVVFRGVHGWGSARAGCCVCAGPA